MWRRTWSHHAADIARTGTDTIDLRHEPTVIMAVGVNGTGKTTTIGKLAWHLQQELGLKVLLGAVLAIICTMTRLVDLRREL